MSLYYLIIALMGYLFGCSNLAFFFGKARGFDIRTRGSKNAGASNATVTMGLKIGFIVGLHDVLKSFAAATLAALLFPAVPGAAAVAGTAAVLGHIFPFYLRFQGGKGFASFMGLALALDWRFFLVMSLIIALITIISDYISLATLTTIFAFPLYLTIHHAGVLIIVTVCIASIVMIFKHLINIKRLIAGEEIGLRRTMSKQDIISQ